MQKIHTYIYTILYIKQMMEMKNQFSEYCLSSKANRENKSCCNWKSGNILSRDRIACCVTINTTL